MPARCSFAGMARSYESSKPLERLKYWFQPSG